MKQVYVADIRPGDQIHDHFQVMDARLAPYRDEQKGHYLHLILADRSGQVDAYLWDDAEDVAEWLAPGEIVQAQARAQLYQGRIRLRLDSIAPAGDDVPGPDELWPAPLVDVGENLAAIHAAVERVSNPALRGLLRSFFSDHEFVEAFSLAPTRKPGHLLHSTVQLLELAAPLPRLAPDLDMDLLLTGILLHDSGQTVSTAGSLGARTLSWLGAAALSDQLLTERLAQAPDFPSDTALRLRHIIQAAADPDTARTSEAKVLARLRQLQAALATST